MNAREFASEVLASDLCPKDFEITYNKFQGYQNLALNTLKEVHRLCESHGIRYQLSYGSLIGAVRDNGQIPWDYDIDIFIPYEDKSKMIESIKIDLNTDFYAYCPEINPECDHTLMRISPVGIHSDAIHVDVFYVMALDNDITNRNAMIHDIGRLFHTRTVKRANIIKDARGSKRKAYNIFKEKVAYLTLSEKKAQAEYDRRCSLYRLSETSYCAPATIDGEKCIYLTNKLWDTEIVELPIGLFRITKDYDNTLRQYYGDYMSVPPLEVRLKEMYGSIRKIEYYAENYN